MLEFDQVENSEVPVNLRVAQSRSARLRTSVAQQSGLPPVQTGSWRSSREAGAATAAAAKAAMMVKNCILTVEAGVLKVIGRVWKFGW